MNRYESHIYKTVALENEVRRLLIEEGIRAWCGMQEALERPEIFPLQGPRQFRVSALWTWWGVKDTFIVTDGLGRAADGSTQYRITGIDYVPPSNYIHISKVWAMARRNLNEQV